MGMKYSTVPDGILRLVFPLFHNGVDIEVPLLKNGGRGI
jgi:hypothetical protein